MPAPDPVKADFGEDHLLYRMCSQMLDEVPWLYGPGGKKLVGSDRFGVVVGMASVAQERLAAFLDERIAAFEKNPVTMIVGSTGKEITPLPDEALNEARAIREALVGKDP